MEINFKTNNGQKRRKYRFVKFGDLAMLYYPTRGYKRAVKLFREELRITGGLQKALAKTGYNDQQRLLTYRQMKIIERYLGEAA